MIQSKIPFGYCDAPAEADKLPVPLVSGCDAPAEAEELPVPLASPPTLPAVQVRQYSWHHYAKNDVSDKRREFVGMNKRTNHGSPFLSQQKPLISRVHLMKVVRKIGKQERSRGKHLTDTLFKNPPLSDGKDVTSLLLPSKRVEGENTPYSVMCEQNNSVNHEYIYINDKYALERSKMQEKEREGEWMFKSQESTNCQKAESRHPGSTTYDATGDGLNSDVTTRVPDINKLIARKRYVPRKRSLTYSVGSFERSLRACIRIITFIVLFVAITTNVLGGLINTRRCERKSTVGTSASLPLFEYSMSNSCCSFLSILRKFSANILGIDEELWPCVIIETNWKDNNRFKRRREVLHNTRIREENSWYENIFRPVTAPPWLRNLRSVNVAKGTFLAGKCLRTYLCLFTDFLASSVGYMIWIHAR